MEDPIQTSSQGIQEMNSNEQRKRHTNSTTPNDLRQTGEQQYQFPHPSAAGAVVWPSTQG